MNKLVPSIMTADPLNLEQELQDLHGNGIDWLHIDVMDGIFVNNLAMGPYVVEPIIKTDNFTIDIHLACIDPKRYIEMFSIIKPDYLTFHIETTNTPEKLIDLIHSKGIKAGIAISPETDIKALNPYLELVDLILVMTVNPRFAGQRIQKHVYKKIKILNKKLENLENRPLIEVDGNIYDETAKKISEYGADLYVLGTSALFNDSKKSYAYKLKKMIKAIT